MISSFLLKSLIGFLTCCLYPLEVIGSRMAIAETPVSMLQATRQIYNNGGLTGFWKGFLPFAANLILSIAVVTIGSNLISRFRRKQTRSLIV